MSNESSEEIFAEMRKMPLDWHRLPKGKNADGFPLRRLLRLIWRQLMNVPFL